MIKITKTHHNFNDVKFVLSACAKDTLKPVYNCVMVQEEEKKSVMYATDARRLHSAEIDIDEMVPGVYEVDAAKDLIIFTKTDEHNFPHVDSIKPDLTGIESIGTIAPRLMGRHNKRDNSLRALSRSFALIVKSFANYIDLEFLRDVLVDEFKVFITGDEKPIVFINCTKKAWVMPMMEKTYYR